MLRTERERDREFALSVVDKCSHGVLSLVTAEGRPYAVALNPVRQGDYIYFHCGKAGRKIDCMRANPRGCFVFVGDTELLPMKMTNRYESAVVFGELSCVEDREEKIMALRLICGRYAKGAEKMAEACIARSLDATGIWKMHIEEISGKSKPGKNE